MTSEEYKASGRPAYVYLLLDMSTSLRERVRLALNARAFGATVALVPGGMLIDMRSQVVDA